MRRFGASSISGFEALGTSPRVEIGNQLDWTIRSALVLTSEMKHVIGLRSKITQDSYSKKETAKGHLTYYLACLSHKCAYAMLPKVFRGFKSKMGYLSSWI